MLLRSTTRLLSSSPSSPTQLSQAAARTLEAEKENQKFLLLAETFQALGDSSRVRIVWHLAQKEYKVGELARVLSMSQPAVSHHLRTLRQLRLVKVRRDGRIAYYSLDDRHINRLLQEGLEHVEEMM